MPKQEDWKAAFDEARAQALNVDAYTFQIAWAYAIAAPTPSASSVPTERQAFETFVTDLIMEARGTEPDFSLDDGSGNHYEDAHINNMWTAWKERARIAAPPANAQADETVKKARHESYAQGWKEGREALAASPAPSALTDAFVDEVMAQAQVFASAWSMVGGPFDFGGALETAEAEKVNLRALLQANGATP